MIAKHSLDDGSLWVWPREEFEDGRFESMAPDPMKGCTTADDIVARARPASDLIKQVPITTASFNGRKS